MDRQAGRAGGGIRGGLRRAGTGRRTAGVRPVRRQRRDLQGDAAVGAAHRTAADPALGHAYPPVGGSDLQARGGDLAQVDRTVGSGHVQVLGNAVAEVDPSIGGGQAQRAAMPAHLERSVAGTRVERTGETVHLHGAVATAQTEPGGRGDPHPHLDLVRLLHLTLLQGGYRRAAVVRLPRAGHEPLPQALVELFAPLPFLKDEARPGGVIAARFHDERGVAQVDLQARRSRGQR